jgi:hypothetical protein
LALPGAAARFEVGARGALITRSTIKAPAPSLLTGLERPTWYFAEGSCDKTDRETLAFLNPGPRTALVVTTLIRSDGRRVYAVTDVDPRSRGTLDASFAAGYGSLLAAVVKSSEPIVAERALYHGSATEEGTGAALTAGQTSTARTWYLPRLKLNSDEQERIAVLNPYPYTVQGAVAYVRKGRLQKEIGLVVPSMSVLALNVPDGATSAVVTTRSKSSGLVVEERTTYGKSRGYTTLAGLTALVTDQFLQRPGAGGGHDTLMVFNPSAVSTVVSLTPMSTPSARTRRVIVPALGQLSVPLHSADLGVNADLRVRSTRPIAAAYVGDLPPSGEAALSKVYRGSVVANLSIPARVFALAEGDTRQILSNPHETLYLANTNAHAAHVDVKMLSTRSRLTGRSILLPAAGSVAISLNAWGASSQHGLIVTSDRPILVLRSIDFNESTDRLESFGAAG